ncbi:hypothetical protein [Streptomyces sp. NBC_01361]|uniref:hypothetical protein n=1 Tax=Streptomyces sp. NBC_01361 TaxID=2903838 RepID=UPI002E32056E|nr:hypothetical protein [Streptomyces sp. NBC_01361]
MRFGRLNGSPATPTIHPLPPPRACDELGDITEPFSPLVGELLALYCHTRPITELSRSERCPEEYQLLARQVIQRLLDGWTAQSRGAGTLDDLLPHRPARPLDDGERQPPRTG